MIYWAQFLHFYQPPTQSASILKKICEESYRPLIKVFEEHPHARASININAVLTEMLADCGHQDIIDGLRRLADQGQFEFTGSGMYHPILPLIPREDISRQINLNAQTNQRYLGKVYQPLGFFPPEMGYSPDILPAITQSGYKWVILSGVACPVEWPMDIIHEVHYGGKTVKVLFRDDILSNRISFRDFGAKEFIEHLRNWGHGRENTYVVTAMDAETYGHHIQEWETIFLSRVFRELKNNGNQTEAVTNGLSSGAVGEIKIVTISELCELMPVGRIIAPKTSSWSTTADDLKAGNPFPLWQDKNNEVHRLQWEHLNICIELVNNAERYADNDESRNFAAHARRLLDRAEYSCQMWWASKRPMWDVNLIHLGMLAQLRVILNAYRAIYRSGAEEKTKRDFYYRTVAARDIRNKLEDRLLMQ